MYFRFLAYRLLRLLGLAAGGEAWAGLAAAAWALCEGASLC